MPVELWNKANKKSHRALSPLLHLHSSIGSNRNYSFVNNSNKVFYSSQTQKRKRKRKNKKQNYKNNEMKDFGETILFNDLKLLCRIDVDAWSLPCRPVVMYAQLLPSNPACSYTVVRMDDDDRNTVCV